MIKVLHVRKCGGRKRVLGTRKPMLLPSRVNERWSLDSVHDVFTHGLSSMILVMNAWLWSQTHHYVGGELFEN